VVNLVAEPFVDIVLNESILLAMLDKCGVRGWNALHSRLLKTDLCLRRDCSAAMSPLFAHLDFSRLNVSDRKDLDGIDLRLCCLVSAVFDDCSLKGAKFANVPKVSFRRSDLRGATFLKSNLSGTCFDGSHLENATFTEAFYFKVRPPTGLPEEVLAKVAVDFLME
jgi:uncharacterized protein YjbI with pentapeptide repeats